LLRKTYLDACTSGLNCVDENEFVFVRNDYFRFDCERLTLYWLKRETSNPREIFRGR
jgi:hypothetical protein